MVKGTTKKIMAEEEGQELYRGEKVEGYQGTDLHVQGLDFKCNVLTRLHCQELKFPVINV